MKFILLSFGFVLFILIFNSCKNEKQTNSQTIDSSFESEPTKAQMLINDSIVLEYQSLNNQLDNLLALRAEKIDSITKLQQQIIPQKEENTKPKLKEVKSQNTDPEIEFLPDNEMEYTKEFEDRIPVDTTKFQGLIKILKENLKRISSDSSVVEIKLEALFQRMPLNDIEKHLSRKYLVEVSKNNESKNKGIANYSETFNYAGDRESDFGGSNHYELFIKKDFSAAAFNGGIFYRLELLSTNLGLYQFIDGPVIGLRLQPSKSTCTVYNFDNSLFCILSKK